MPPRFPSVQAALRSGAKCSSQQPPCAQLSTTSRAAALKNFVDPYSGPRNRRQQQKPTSSHNNNTNTPAHHSPARPTQSSTDAILALYKEGSGSNSNSFRDDPLSSSSPGGDLLSPFATPGAGGAGGALSRRGAAAAAAMQEVSEAALSGDYMRQQPRRWRAGDVYAPRDLGPGEMMKWRRRQTVKDDVLDMLGLNPLDNYRNFSMISEFMTPFGRIKHSQDTGLRPANQRKMAKAIRRAVGLGIHPSVHRHPELLRRESQNMAVQTRSSDPTRKKTFM